ncbi:MAG: ASPIC/UnbV domain-containing protein [Pirellulales bacterium]|nr:ASPIC/UnbV domain-containing protein [Pirellulales bacterium]
MTLAGSPRQLRQRKGGGGYQATRDPRLFFAVDGGSSSSLTVRWPSGAESQVDGLVAGGRYVIIEPVAETPPRILVLQEPER